jgi:CubicO group peptidase (beta-lactamase class C family)
MLSDTRLEAAARAVDEWAGQDPAASAYPGAVAVVMQNGKVLLRHAVGQVWAQGSEPMSAAHVFDVASVTKTIATAASALTLLQRGKLCLEDTVDEFLPSLRGSALGGVRIWHLMTHTAGFAEVPPMFEIGAVGEDPADILSRAALSWPAGSHVNYSCKGYIVLGRVIEAVTGMQLDEYARRNVFEPLRMENTSYLPLDTPIPERMRAVMVPSEARSATPRGVALRAAWARRGMWMDEWRERHRLGPGGSGDDRGSCGDVAFGCVHDENAAWLGGVSGNAGVFSTADDLARFGQMWLERGVAVDGTRVLSQAVVELATRSWTGGMPGGDNRGLGWQLPTPDMSFGDLAPPGTMGVTGFTGAGLWVVPAYGVVAVLLSNRLQFTRRNERITRVRRLFMNAVLAALAD